jgi:hypothetical protein
VPDPVAPLSSSPDLASTYTVLNGVEVERPLTGSFDPPVSLLGFEEHNYTSTRDNSLEELTEVPHPHFSNASRPESLCQNKQRKSSPLSSPCLSSDAGRENEIDTRVSEFSDENPGIEGKASPETVPLGSSDLHLDNNYSELVSVAMQAIEIVSKRRPSSYIEPEPTAEELSPYPERMMLTSTKEGEVSRNSSYIRDAPLRSSVARFCPLTTDMHQELTLELSKSSMDTMQADETNGHAESPTSASVSLTTVISPLSISAEPKPLKKHSEKVNGGTTEEPGPERLVHRELYGVNSLETENRYRETQAEDTGKGIPDSRRALLNYQKIKNKSSNIPMCNAMFPSAFSTLGTLSTFMEIRGRGNKRRKTEKSPYFNEVSSENIMTNSSNIQVQVHGATLNDEMPEEGTPEPDYTYSKPETFRNATQSSTPLLLIISAALLQSDRHLVRRLENSPHAPRLIFREYTAFMSRGFRSKEIKTVTEKVKLDEQKEADIIVSPQTGIILTASQETTQLYLPGHKRKKPPGAVDGVRSSGFDSPLQERIAHVAMRYEQIYVLIRLPLESGQNIPLTGIDSKSSAKSKLMATDTKTLSSIRSLMAFCASIGRFSAIIPLLVPASEIEIVDWICSIARKHAFNPTEIQKRISQSRRTQDVVSSYFAATTPSTDEFLSSPSLVCSSLLSYLDEETQWEIFLRRAGFNPFAAQTVLGILKIIYQQRVDSVGGINNDTGEEGRKGPDDSKALPEISTISTVSGNTNIGPEVTTGSVPPAQGLSLFVELDRAERGRLFGEIVGERVLRRVERCILQDWQLDWAVNLDDDIEMDMEIDTPYMGGDVH